MKIGARSQKLWPFEVSGPNIDFSSLLSAASAFRIPRIPLAQMSQYESPLFWPNRLVRVCCVLLSRLSRTAWDKFFRFARFGRFAYFCPNCPGMKVLISADLAGLRTSRTFGPTVPGCLKSFQPTRVLH
ncbi:hypothetical protein KI387_010926, partial [Taxus chinensis]